MQAAIAWAFVNVPEDPQIVNLGSQQECDAEKLVAIVVGEIGADLKQDLCRKGEEGHYECLLWWSTTYGACILKIVTVFTFRSKS
jgi:hypothetical protein